MKHVRIKQILTFIAALLLLSAMSVAYVYIGMLSDTDSVMEQIQQKVQSLMPSVSELMRSYDSVYMDYDAVLKNNAKLCAVPLMEDLSRDGDGAILMYDYGCVVRVDGDRLILPDDPGVPAMKASDFTNEDGTLADRGFFETTPAAQADAGDTSGGDGAQATMICAFERLDGNYYYVDLSNTDALKDFLVARVDLSTILADLEDVYGGYIVLFYPDGEYYPLIRVPEAFTGEYWSLMDMGIDPKHVGDKPGVIELEGRQCIWALSDPEQREYQDGSDLYEQIALLIPTGNLLSHQYPRLLWALNISLLFFIVAIAWVHSSVRLFRSAAVTEFQRKQYGVKRTRRVVASIGVIGTLMILLSTMFVDSLMQLYTATQDNRSRLTMINNIASQTQDNQTLDRKQRESICVGYAQRIAGLLAEHSHLHDADALEQMCRIIGADYLMIFDDKGREVLSNAPYVNLKFGLDETSDTYEFRKLLTGVPSIVHDVSVSEATGLKRQLIGVCMDDGDISDGYGALIMALTPQEDFDAMTVDELMEVVTPDGDLCMTLNPETGDILSSSDPSLIGENALSLGMTSRALADAFMDYITLSGTRWYSCSNVYGDAVYHSAIQANAIYHRPMRNALAFAACFLAGYALLALMLLIGYTDRAIDAYGAQVVEDDEALLHMTAPAANEDEAAFTVAMKNLRTIQIGHTPEKRTWFTFSLAGGIMLFDILMSLQLDVNARDQFFILNYVLNGKWAPGINLFAIAKIILVSLIVALLLLFLRLITRLACATLQKRGETICKLIYSFIRLASILGLLYYAFTYLGFDTRTLLASVGLLSLTLSLGAKDLVADVLSGVTIAFSDEYQIGDYIDISGFRGWVQDIGIRSTTLVNNDGNIKNFSNRDVKNVLNLSRRNCCYTINVTIAYDQPLKKVEEILKRELPRIGEENEEIIKGPVYKGVTNLGAGGVTLAITAECKEQHYGKVRSRINREIRLILEDNGITIK